jgi:sodium transport system permease protein
MKRFRFSSVFLILSRELRDQLRDRRTLFMIGVLPLLLYPLIGMSLMQMAQFMRRNSSRVLIVTSEPLLEQPALVRDGQFTGLTPRDAALMTVDVQQRELPSPKEAALEATSAIDDAQYDVVICIPPGFKDRIETIRQTGAAPQTEHSDSKGGWPVEAWRNTTEPLVFYSTAKDRSRIAYDRVSVAMQNWRTEIVNETLDQHDISPAATMPFGAAGQDVAAPLIRRAAIWSKILPFVLVIWAMTGAFYPAVDLCAGEKERGTLETLLCSPAERVEIVWGKLLTIMIFSVATAMLNLACMCLTSTYIAGQFHGIMTAGAMQSLGPPPFQSYIWLLLALLPISALFSALSLALATMARSTKEGQYYLMPLMLLTMPLLILPMLPSVELDLGLALVPVSGILLLLRQLMEQNFQQALLYCVPVICVTAGCCWIATRWAVDQFNNESVLFRESERFSLRLWLRQLIRDRMPTPTVAQAFLCGIVIILVRFFVGLSTPPPDSWNSFAMTTATSLLAMILVPAVLMAIVLTSRPTLTLLMRSTSFMSLAAAAALAVVLHPLAVSALTFVRTIYPIDESVIAPFEIIFAQAPGLFGMLLILAILPAICEEFAFRGFILSGLRHLGHPWGAILLSAVLFGVAHGVIQQSIVAGLFGVVLGYIAVQTGSIWPCIIFHAAHNSMGILSPRWINVLMQRGFDSPWLIQTVSVQGEPSPIYGVPVVIGGLVLAGVIFHWLQRLPMEKSSEERLLDAIEHQTCQPAQA